MIRVTFSQALVIAEENLADLLRAARGNPMTVEYLGDTATELMPAPAAPVARQRRTKSMSDAPAPVQTGKKRGRKSNAEKAAIAAAEAAAAAAAGGGVQNPEPAAADPAPAADPEPDAVAAKKAAAAEAAAAKKAAAAEAAAAKKAAAAEAKKNPTPPADKKNGKSKEPAGDSGPEVNSEELLSRFSTLIDKDFEAAKGILDGFGVNRFSELGAGHYSELSAKLGEAGV